MGLSAGDAAMYAHVAVEEDDAALLEEIARHGGDVTAACCSDGTTPLHRAVQDGNARMVRILLEHGADADCKDDRGLTPRAMADRHGHGEIQALFASHSQHEEPRIPKPSSAAVAPLVARFRSAPARRVPPRDSVGSPSSPKRPPPSSSSSSARSTPQRMASFRNSLFGVMSSSAQWNRHDAGSGSLLFRGGGGMSFRQHEREGSLVRVTISCPEQTGEERRLVFMPETMRQLLELGESKFGFATTRVVTSDGAEVDDTRLVRDGDHLLLVSDQWAAPGIGSTGMIRNQ